MYKKITEMFPSLIKSSSSAELVRTYIVGAINLVFGTSLNYIFQFYILVFIGFPLRTYLSNILQFLIGVVVAYLLTRRIVFNLESLYGTFKEFRNFVSVTLISIIVPLIVWFVINSLNAAVQQNEMQYLFVTVLIHGTILPLKYVIYKLFVFKSSLKK